MATPPARSFTLQNRQRGERVDVRRLRQAIAAFLDEFVADREFEIGMHIVADPEMTRLNEHYLQHAGSTDVITFDYSSPDSESLAGEIFACADEARSQARRFHNSLDAELVRYFVHGVLHLQGHDDSTPAVRRIMKREENRVMRRLARQFGL
jgi:rRNA maturation RNase YbeY